MGIYKRMTGNLHSLLMPEITYPMVQLSIGDNKGEYYELPECCEYEEILDLDHFRSDDDNYSKGCYISYLIKRDEIYQLGDKIFWNGQEYVVLEKELLFDRGIMEGIYLLGV